uniref:F-box domain-containing protein n=1 Tax=Moniliophthora roreri TaxID=221103 RepID=A0A0W0G971_MONRR
MHDIQIVLCDRCNHTFTSRTHTRPEIEHFRSAMPSEADTARHHMVIDEGEKELMRYDVELEKLREIIRNMESEKNALQAQISERRYLVSAIRRVPVEIWDAIFRDVVVSWPKDYWGIPAGYSLYVHYDWDFGASESEHERASRQPGNVIAPPLILSQVSSHWRTLVKSLPHLWSSISVDTYGLDRDICLLLEMYYKNSGEHPLTIEIIDSGWKGDNGFDHRLQYMIEELDWDPEEASRIVFLSLMMEMYRCRELRLDLVEDHLETGDALDVSFPILRSFTNGNRCDPGLSELQWLWRAIRRAPHLIHVETSHFRNLPMVPFRQLKSLTISSARGLSRLLSTLSSCPHMDTLNIQDFRRDPMEDQQTGSVVLVAVRDFTVNVNDWEPEQVRLLLSSLTIPSLVKLEIHSWFDGSEGSTASSQHDNWPWQCLYSFLERSSCPLKELSISISARMFVGGVHILSQIFRLSRSLISITLTIVEHIRDSPPPNFQSCISEMFSRLSVRPPGPSSSPSQVDVPVLRRFHLRLEQDRHPLPKVEIGKDILSFAKSRSKQQLELWGMADTILPLIEFSFKIQKNGHCRMLEHEGVLPVFVKGSDDENKDLLKPLRALTAGGMGCAIYET